MYEFEDYMRDQARESEEDAAAEYAQDSEHDDE